MLISHRNSAYVDIPELERGAGRIEQILNSETPLNLIEAAHLEGAALILRLLCEYDFKTADDMVLVFKRALQTINEDQEG